MRTVALGLFALAGCNQLLGLDSVIATDGGTDAPPYDAPRPVVSLSAITPTLGMDERATGEASKVSLSGAGTVKVQYGLIGETLQSLTTGTYKANQDIEIPQTLLDMRVPWRLVYSVDNGVAKEVHFTGSEPTRSVAELQMTPFSRQAVTPNTSLILNPSNAPATFPFVHIWSTNAWSEAVLSPQAGPTLTVDLESLTAIEGVKRAPGPSDEVMLAGFELQNPGDCLTATRAVAFQFAVSDAPVVDPTPPAWTPPILHAATEVTAAGGAGAGVDLALATERPTLTGLGTTSSLTLTPTGKVPLFRTTTPVPSITGATMVSCTSPDALMSHRLPTFATTFPPFKLVGSFTFSYSLTLATGTQIVVAFTTASASGLEATQFQLPYTITFPNKPTVGGTSVALDQTNVVSVPLAGGTSQLAWTSVNKRDADAYQITLYQVTGTPQPIREYMIAGGPLTFDTQLIQANTSYAFRIRALRGMPEAKTGRFDTWNETQEVAQVWTQAFKRQ